MYTLKKSIRLHSSNDHKRLQTFDRITSYPYGASAGKVCKTELLSKGNIKSLILIIILMKIKQNIIQSGHIFQIIQTEYSLQVVQDQEKQMHY